MAIKQVFYIHALSSIHSGTGQGVGAIDLPVARENATGLPIIPGSTIKGVLRDSFPESDKAKVSEVFGEADDVKASHAGAITFGDARLLCLPVRSFYGTFAWVTSPLPLERFKRDSGITVPPLTYTAHDAYVADDTIICKDGKAYLEDLDLVVKNEEVLTLACAIGKKIFADETWQNLFKQRFIVVKDDIFAFFYKTCLEVSAHIKINDDTKTTQGQALWYEEALPAETIMWGAALADKPHKVASVFKSEKEVADFAIKNSDSLQIGGKATTGKGRIRFIKG